MRGGVSNRSGVDLVNCPKCPGNVKLKVPKSTKGANVGDDILETGVSKFPANPLKSQLTVVGTVYYQCPNEETEPMELGFSRWLNTTAQACKRRLTVGKDWKRLVDVCWLEAYSNVVVKNHKTQFQVQPTKEEADAAAAKVLELTFDATRGKPDLYILPGECAVLNPTSLKDIWVRCLHGDTSYTVFVVPS